MSDQELAAELEEVAQWIDSLYERLRGAEIMFATESGNEAYCESLQADIERVVEIGVAANRVMEHCACLFEALGGNEVPREFLLKARAEINNLAVAIRQQANDLHHTAENPGDYVHPIFALNDELRKSPSDRKQWTRPAIAKEFIRRMSGSQRKDALAKHGNTDELAKHYVDKLRNHKDKLLFP